VQDALIPDSAWMHADPGSSASSAAKNRKETPAFAPAFSFAISA
jgi:hypothetical protein